MFLEAYWRGANQRSDPRSIIGDLLVQAVTAATKEIETKLSGELWNRQRVWEMKREVLFNAAEKEMDATIALTWCVGVRGERKREALLEFVKALDEFMVAIGMTALVCSKETKEELDHVFYELTQLSKQVQGDESGDLDFMKGEYTMVTGRANDLVRKELGVDS